VADRENVRLAGKRQTGESRLLDRTKLAARRTPYEHADAEVEATGANIRFGDNEALLAGGRLAVICRRVRCTFCGIASLEEDCFWATGGASSFASTAL
jgi:hypothetical protein